MKLTSMSASRLSTYLECPYKYKLRYHDGIEPPEKTDASEFGNWLHKGFERCVKEERNLKEILKEELGNYTFSNSYLRNLPAILQNFEKVNSKLEKGLTETPFTIQEGTSVPLKGIIDRIVIKGEKVLVLDYKTGKVQKSRKHLKNDPQLLMYCYAVSHLVKTSPDHIHLALFYVLSGDIEDVSFSREEINQFILYLERIVQEILNLDPEKAKPSINKWCSSCPYQCQTYQRFKSLKR